MSNLCLLCCNFDRLVFSLFPFPGFDTASHQGEECRVVLVRVGVGVMGKVWDLGSAGWVAMVTPSPGRGPAAE